MIDKARIKKYLSIVKELKSDFIFYDSHTHPFEVIFDQVDYHANKTKTGVFSTNGCEFVPPKLATIVIKKNHTESKNANQTLQNKISQMIIQRIYSHIGPCVFNEHMCLSGIDQSLLLPVAPASGLFENQMLSMNQLYGNDKRFAAGTSIPNSVQNADINSFIDKMIDKYNIKAVKIHPNITEIDIASNTGKERLEAILSACGESGLPLVIHGGKSKILKNSKASEYGKINNLKKVNWSLCKSIVVIAHAGGHSCMPDEMETKIIPNLKKMLQCHDNLMVDTAALDINMLNILFRYIEPDRILFGTDALYEQQWATIAKIWHSLKSTFSKVEEKFIQIASINPSKYIFGEEKKC